MATAKQCQNHPCTNPATHRVTCPEDGWAGSDVCDTCYVEAILSGVFSPETDGACVEEQCARCGVPFTLGEPVVDVTVGVRKDLPHAVADWATIHEACEVQAVRDAAAAKVQQ